jgi:hypothetical protein
VCSWFSTNLVKMENKKLTPNLIEIPKVENKTFTPDLFEIPKVVGSYEITGTKENAIEFNFTKKPKLINRIFCKWCLGWTWRDK